MVIRFFCLPVPGPAGDLSYDYLTAFRDTGRGVRAISILGGILGFEGRWSKISQLFVAPLGQPFVNVVCSPPGVMRGTKLVAGPRGLIAGMDHRDAGADPQLALERRRERENESAGKVVYVPETALRSLYTVGCPNIAITRAWPKPPDAEEAAALANYDRIVCPVDEEAAALRQIGLDVICMPPAADQLAALLDDL